MKNRKLLPALSLILCLLLSACGASSGASSPANGKDSALQEAPAPYEPEGGGGPSADGDMGFTEEAAPDSSGGGEYYDNTKIIRTADLSLQSTEFDAAVEGLNALVAAQEGYFESSSYSYGGYSGGESRWGEFTVRVPQEKFDPFLNAVGDVAHVVSRDTGTEDVGEAYYDAELHRATLETKHERLLALLERAEEMEDIIALESALSDVEYQIQQYTSTLTRYDALINFSTIHIYLREVVRVSETTTETDPLSARVGAAFSRGWHSFCDSAADFAVWLAYNFMGVLIFLGLVAAAVLLLRRVRRRKRRLPTPPPEGPGGGEG